MKKASPHSEMLSKVLPFIREEGLGFTQERNNRKILLQHAIQHFLHFFLSTFIQNHLKNYLQIPSKAEGSAMQCWSWVCRILQVLASGRLPL